MIRTLFSLKKPAGSVLYAVAINEEGRFSGFLVPLRGTLCRKPAGTNHNEQFHTSKDVKGNQMTTSNKLNRQQADMVIKALCDGVASGSISVSQIDSTKEALVASVAAVNLDTSTLRLVSWRELWRS